jgi:hypothetical protein
MLITFKDVEPRSTIELTRNEILAISEEITLKFSPNKTLSPPIDLWAPACVNPNPPLPVAALPQQPKIQGFSYNELQAISQDISRHFAPKASNRVAEIFLLPVDPHHVYAYWETGSCHPPMTSHPDLQEPLNLRIYWRPDAEREITDANLWFDIPADNTANRKKIRLPIDDTNYSAALGRLNPNHSLEVLAHSNLVHVPASPGKKRFSPLLGNADRKEPMPDFPSTMQQECMHLPEGWPTKLYAGHQAALTCESPDICAAFMSFFNESRIDAERVLEPEPKKPFHHASGLGL